MKWFLEKKAGANIPRQNAASIGSIVHALAQGLSNSEINPNFEALKEKLDQIWPQLSFDAPWLGTRFYNETLEVVMNLLSWHLKRTSRTVVGSAAWLISLPNTSFVFANFRNLFANAFLKSSSAS